jgi:hypothetical protein
MKKSILIILLLLVSFSGNLVSGATQTLSVNRGVGDEMFDRMTVNVNSYVNYLSVNGVFTPGLPTGNPYDTYWDTGVYHTNSLNTFYNTLVNHLYSSNTSNPPNFTYVNNGYNNWDIIDVYTNVSNGTANITVEWF